MNIFCFEVKYHQNWWQLKRLERGAKGIRRERGVTAALEYIARETGWDKLNVESFFNKRIKGGVAPREWRDR